VFLLQIQGKCDLEIKLANDSGFIPDATIEIKSIKIECSLEITLDMVTEYILIGFREKPTIEGDVEVEVSRFNIPLFGEDFWFPKLVANYLEKCTPEDPIAFRFDL